MPETVRRTRHFEIGSSLTPLSLIQYTPLLLQRKARKLRRETGDARYWAPLDKKSTKFKALAYNVLLDPFKMLFEEPMLLAITVYLSLYVPSMPPIIYPADSLSVGLV